MSKIQNDYNEQEKRLAAAELRKMLKPGDTVYTLTRHTSSSGMHRRISTFIVAKSEHTKKPELRCIDWYVRTLTVYQPKARLDGIVVNGCGFDAGYDIVQALGMALWPKGTSKAHSTRNGKPDNAGAYALNHRWI